MRKYLARRCRGCAPRSGLQGAWVSRGGRAAGHRRCQRLRPQPGGHRALERPEEESVLTCARVLRDYWINKGPADVFLITGEFCYYDGEVSVRRAKITTGLRKIIKITTVKNWSPLQ